MVVHYNLPVDVLTAAFRDWLDINPSEDSILQPALGLRAQAMAARATSGGRRIPSGAFAKYNIGWERCDGVA
jgi:hypothetical protein